METTLATAMLERWHEAASGDAIVLRQALGSFATGVTVVVTRGSGEEVRAFTANSFTSVSLDPPLVLVCLAKTSLSLAIFAETTAFSINVLSDGQRQVASDFASRDAVVKARAVKDLVHDEVPFVERSLATLICGRDRVIDAGDHVILLGRIQRFRAVDGQPLGFFRGGYVGIGPDVREIEQLGAAIVIAGVLRVDGQVLLCRRPGAQSWEIPAATLAHGERHDKVIERRFERLGIQSGMSVPYSLFQEAGERHTTFVFSVESRGEVKVGRSEDGTETALFGPDLHPWTLVAGRMKQALLRRYLSEMASGLFNMYFDTLDGGSLLPTTGRPRSWSEDGVLSTQQTEAAQRSR